MTTKYDGLGLLDTHQLSCIQRTLYTVLCFAFLRLLGANARACIQFQEFFCLSSVCSVHDLKDTLFYRLRLYTLLFYSVLSRCIPCSWLGVPKPTHPVFNSFHCQAGGSRPWTCPYGSITNALARVSSIALNRTCYTEYSAMSPISRPSPWGGAVWVSPLTRPCDNTGQTQLSRSLFYHCFFSTEYGVDMSTIYSVQQHRSDNHRKQKRK